MSQATSITTPGPRESLTSLAARLADQLRAAAVAGDDGQTVGLLKQLLRLRGMTNVQQTALQVAVLLELVHSLRATCLTDELTGLPNRRGFLQFGTRFLDVAVRERRTTHLVYLELDHLALINDSSDHIVVDALLRQMGNLMRDLFPCYGVHEVLGRLGGNEFAALTTSAEYALRSAIMLRARRPPSPGGAPAYGLPPLSLSVGVAVFDPQRPVLLEELLERSKHAMQEHKHSGRNASPESYPPAGPTRL
jgi:diguanylate cyclase (GGDEF)-like protein